MPGHTPTLIPHKEWVCPYSGRKQGTTDLLLPSAASSGAPIRPCLISCWPLNKLYWLEKAKNPTRYQIHGSQGGAAVPFWGEDLATKRSFLGADKRPREPLVSVSLLSVKSAFPAPGGLRTSFKECFPLPLVLLPLLKSLYFSSLFLSSRLPRQWMWGSYSLPPRSFCDLLPLASNSSSQ